MKTATFQNYRPRILTLAYRMLGSVSEAEDVVQDTWLRCQNQTEKLAQLEAEDSSAATAYLFRITTNLCIDCLRKRKQGIQQYQGPWLPDPLVSEIYSATEFEVSEQVMQLEEFSFGLLFMLENLNPNERAVFVLREAFDFEHHDIAAMLDIQTDHCRQLLRRARQKLAKESARKSELRLTTTSEQRRQQRSVLEKFMAAFAEADTEKIVALMTEDAVAYSDGGGVVSAALVPLEGPERITQVFLHLATKNESQVNLLWAEINSQIGLVIPSNNGLESVITIETHNGLVHRIYIQRNPHKLKHLPLKPT